MPFRLKICVCILLLFVVTGCSVKRNNFFSRNYHQMTTRYNVYFNGNEALKAGVKKMENAHSEDYTALLPVFVSNDDQTRGSCSSDMDYAIEKAAKAIDKHSITVKPRRRKNKDSRSYEIFRKKKEFNNQLDLCYVLLGKAYFYKKKYAMANNTFRFIQRQYPEDEKLLTEVSLWLFRSLTELGRYDEAAKFMNELGGKELNKQQREMFAAAKTDYYIRQEQYALAVSEAEKLAANCKSMKRKPRYNFILSQLYLKDNQDAQAMAALKKVVRFNFNYEMVFNAKINMALAYQSGDDHVKKVLSGMLRDVRNSDYKDRIYYALGNIEEKKGDEEAAVDLYWKSVRSSLGDGNQQSMSFLKLGDYYFKGKDYIMAQSCYDSCLLMMDSRNEGYGKLKTLVTDLTDLVVNLRTVQKQDSLQRLAVLPEKERNDLIDGIIQDIKDKKEQAKEQDRKNQAERDFYSRNNMLSSGDAFAQTEEGSDWYFYNPVTVTLGKNDFKRKWGRRRLEDNWRRQNKAMVEVFAVTEEDNPELQEENVVKDSNSREFYLKDLPLTEEAMAASDKKIQDAYYRAGEIYQYKFNDPEKALECFEGYINRFADVSNLPMVYYLAYKTAEESGNRPKAERYKNDLVKKYPDSDFSRGIQDPGYFRKVDSDLKIIEGMYQRAYDKYRQVYYEDALNICEEILDKYPENKLKSNVLFLRAMCMVNVRQPQEAREALNMVVSAGADKETLGIVNSVLAALSIGEKPVIYSEADMADERALKNNRNWSFDETGTPVGVEGAEQAYKAETAKPHCVILMLPENFKPSEATKTQSRVAFINAAESAEGKDYTLEKADLWNKKTALIVGTFGNYREAAGYLERIATDKLLLKMMANRSYRMFAITDDNLALLKRLRNVDNYVDFFTGNYFEDRKEGELMAGKLGASAHIFKYEENEKHDFVLLLPFRKVNVKQVAESLRNIESAFAMMKEDYDEEREMIVVREVGTKAQALEYMNAVINNKDIFDRLAAVDNQSFVITRQNLQILLENGYLDEYIKFFDDNYMKGASKSGIEEGDFIYNKSQDHKFVLFYPNQVDPFKLKAVFDEFNFAGLTLNNLKYDAEHDCMVVSGFNNKDEAMRYFNTVINNRKLFKPLKNMEYTNFVISGANLEIMKEKQLVEKYLEFFKKYYLGK